MSRLCLAKLRLRHAGECAHGAVANGYAAPVTRKSGCPSWPGMQVSKIEVLKLADLASCETSAGNDGAHAAASLLTAHFETLAKASEMRVVSRKGGLSRAATTAWSTPRSVPSRRLPAGAQGFRGLYVPHRCEI
jgi:hypothetical protein